MGTAVACTIIGLLVTCTGAPKPLPPAEAAAVLTRSVPQWQPLPEPVPSQFHAGSYSTGSSPWPPFGNDFPPLLMTGLGSGYGGGYPGFYQGGDFYGYPVYGGYRQGPTRSFAIAPTYGPGVIGSAGRPFAGSAGAPARGGPGRRP